ncbi:SH3 domain-containing protein [Chondrinema litorale]|uniref:SH3 domain-containing protein n=1 Tax=Chondrinema litorale TaxID=2994555 RepID=UPI0025437E2E|nr:SH3 domain-containing protein [Chondrinema litorale]UZR94775.1 SH3 domain-containing protein [Chondrinema litorale]
MQRFQIKIFIFLSILFFSFTKMGFGAPPGGLLAAGDSLFKSGKYTESFEEYKNLIEIYDQYTPQMLLKMAFIKEGLGDYTQTLYYLNLYFLENADRSVIDKIAGLASKHELDGYKMDDNEYFSALFRMYYIYIFLFFITVSVIFLFVIIGKRAKRKEALVPAIILSAFVAIFFFLGNFFMTTSKGIIADNNTLFMNAPSAGSSLIEKLEKGHRIEILGKDDIWYKISWNNKEGYIRDSNLLLVE